MKKNIIKKSSDKGIIISLTVVLFLFIIFVISVLVISSLQDKKNANRVANYENNNKQVAVNLNIETSEKPFIENVSLNKEKYHLGDDMVITAEIARAKGVKALIENETGYHEVALTLANNIQDKQIWTGTWIVRDALDMKEYSLKIIASNEFGQAEISTSWIDPLANPGHYLSRINVDVNLNMATKDIYNATDITALNDVNSKNVKLELGGGGGITFADGTYQDTAAVGSIASSSVWVQKGRAYGGGCVASLGWRTYASHTVGSLGGHLGTSEIIHENPVTFCVSGKRILVNGIVQASSADRVDIPLPPNALVEIQSQCQATVPCNVVYSITGKLGLWDF